jgi:hypothetical protein
MKQARIQVTVSDGMFASERSVSFDAGDRKYHLLVDEDDVSGDEMNVNIVSAPDEDTYIVQLPRETFTTGHRVRVPRGVVKLVPV